MNSVKNKKGRLLVCLFIIVFIIETYFAFDMMVQDGLNKGYEYNPRGTWDLTTDIYRNPYQLDL